MEYLQNMKDSVETSVSIKLFSSLNISSYYHIFKSKLLRFPLSKCRELHNFNSARLSKDPYPKEDRPRGQKDLESVLHHRRIIRQHGHTEPIWIALDRRAFQTGTKSKREWESIILKTIKYLLSLPSRSGSNHAHQ